MEGRSLKAEARWKVLRYNQKLNETTGQYRLEVDLEHVEGQLSMTELAKIPRPSNLDDWDLFQRLGVKVDERRRTERGPPQHGHAQATSQATTTPEPTTETATSQKKEAVVDARRSPWQLWRKRH